MEVCEIYVVRVTLLGWSYRLGIRQ